ncbi:hypothetical protein D3C78_909250 [compost metagenome]
MCITAACLLTRIGPHIVNAIPYNFNICAASAHMNTDGSGISGTCIVTAYF